MDHCLTCGETAFVLFTSVECSNPLCEHHVAEREISGATSAAREAVDETAARTPGSNFDAWVHGRW